MIWLEDLKFKEGEFMAYQSIFDRMNRKQKREFDNLPVDEKMKIFTTEYQNAVFSQMADEITNSFYRGYLQAHRMLYEDFISKILLSEKDEEIQELYFNLLKKIQDNYDLAIADAESIEKKESEK